LIIAPHGDVVMWSGAEPRDEQGDDFDAFKADEPIVRLGARPVSAGQEGAYS
jgi:hypothetical protein